MLSHRLFRDATDTAAPAAPVGVPGKVSTTSRVTIQRAPVLQRAEDRAADADGVSDDAEAMVAHADTSTGRALDGDVRERFESSLGVDLSGVRVHTGGASQDAAAAIGARAYATGNDIHFGAGQYDTSSGDGLFLIAHEVAHTVQQAGGATGRQHKLEVSSPGDALETEADAVASAMVAGTPATVSPGSGLARAIHRTPTEGAQAAAAQPAAAPPAPGSAAGARPGAPTTGGEHANLGQALFGGTGYFAAQARGVGNARTDLRGTASQQSFEQLAITLAGAALSAAAGGLGEAIAARVIARFAPGAAEDAVKTWTERLTSAITTPAGWGIEQLQDAARLRSQATVAAFIQLHVSAITALSERYADEWSRLDLSQVRPEALTNLVQETRAATRAVANTQYAQTTGKWMELQFGAADQSRTGHHGFTGQSYQIGLEAQLASPSATGIQVDAVDHRGVPDDVMEQLGASPPSTTVNDWGGRLNVQLTVHGADGGSVEPAEIVRGADGNTWIQARSANDAAFIAFLNGYAEAHGLTHDPANRMSLPVANRAVHHILTVLLGRRPLAGVIT